jgi:N-succinyldiaminopimelate aminotransferase
MTRRLNAYRSSVFEEMTTLAQQYNAIDLGAGTPDLPMPDAVARAACEAIRAGNNQYSLVAGELTLRRAVAEHSARFYGQQVDPLAEVTITSGVTEGIYAAVNAFVEPGDEVIVFEPFYDSYVPSIQLAGGTAVPVSLDMHAFEEAFSPRTKALILNDPHNPTGKVFSLAELEHINALCQQFDVLAITDEVYEHIIFDDKRHIRLATLPGMWERTLTLSGASKTFSSTGWRIGWAIGPEPLQKALNTFRQFNVFCAATPLQLGIAAGLALPDRYFADLAAEYQSRRDLLMDALAASPFEPLQPSGSFFVLASFDPAEYANGRECCYALARDSGVAPIPLDTFYMDPRRAGNTVRFTFCQPREKLLEAANRLSQVRAC